MIASPHIVVGSALGLWSFNTFKDKRIVITAAFFAGIASHFILDLIPHKEYPKHSLEIVFAIDLLFAILISLRFGLIGSLNYSNWALIAGMIGGSLPDIPFFFIRTHYLNWEWLYTAASVNTYFHAAPGLEPKIIVPLQMLIAMLAIYAVKMNRETNLKLLIRGPS